MTDLMSRVMANLYDGNSGQVVELVRQALDQGMSPDSILGSGLVAGMDEVGRDFKSGELFVPEVLLAARAMHAGMDVLRPLLIAGGTRSAGKCLIGTVRGDLHDIGKNLVKMMWEGAGFEVIDIGTDVAAEAFVEAVGRHQPDILGMSALLTTTMMEMKKTVDALAAAGLRDSIYVVIGGAPVTHDFAIEIGADAYAPDAASAVDVARMAVV